MHASLDLCKHKLLVFILKEVPLPVFLWSVDSSTTYPVSQARNLGDLNPPFPSLPISDYLQSPINSIPLCILFAFTSFKPSSLCVLLGRCYFLPGFPQLPFNCFSFLQLCIHSESFFALLSGWSLILIRALWWQARETVSGNLIKKIYWKELERYVEI